MTMIHKSLFAAIAFGIILAVWLAPDAQKAHAANGTNEIIISEWQMMWEEEEEGLSIGEMIELGDRGAWFDINSADGYPDLPAGITSAWVRFKLPELRHMRPAMEIRNLLAQDVVIYIGQTKVFEVQRTYIYDRNKLMVPLAAGESGKYVHIYMNSHMERLGLQSDIAIDDHANMLKNGMNNDIVDVVIGSSLVIIASFMMLSVVFLNRYFLPGWVSLFLVMLSIGVMILSYSSFFDRYYSEYGNFMYYAFDVASSLLMPTLLLFFEKIFGKGPHGIISRCNRVLVAALLLSLSVMVLGFFIPFFGNIYPFFSMIYLAFVVILGNVVLVYALVHYFKKRNKEAIIMAIGLGSFAVITILEMCWYFYTDKMHAMTYWKFGIVFFLGSLIIMLVRRIMRNYETALEYSRQLELFNNELQRSEKIEMISHLAASIAHEVRNPLQVTRGFLQILRDKSTEDKAKGYTKLAIEELDRAAEIITDFLTFAKPDLGEVARLNVAQELQQIEAILMPFATMQGGVITLSVEENLYITGNSSKFKQALINIIKNSIEALREDGIVAIRASKNSESNDLSIVVQDNGEGIEEADLKRLGEPYYSKKSKGTGLGLMVTFRIIEAMQGNVSIESTKGVGTEVRLTLPFCE